MRVAKDTRFHITNCVGAETGQGKKKHESLRGGSWWGKSAKK